MKIEIKQKIIENEQLIVFFDVIDEGKYWIDPDNQGYFPITIKSPSGRGIGVSDLTDEEIKTRCQQWLEENDILKKYCPINPEIYEAKKFIMTIDFEALKTTSCKTIADCEQTIKKLIDLCEAILKYMSR